MQIIRDCVGFLVRLGLLLLAKLVLVVIAIAEAMGMIWISYWSVARWDDTGHARWVWLPFLAMVGVYIQWALWQFLWMRYGQKSDRHRPIAEYFAITLRHPIARPPRDWE